MSCHALLPCDLCNPGIEPKSLTSPAFAGGFFTISATWEAPKCTLLNGKRLYLEKAMATHSSKSHGQRSLVGCSPWGRQESDTTDRLHFHFSLSCIEEGNGSPLQCSCLENPTDGRASWAAIYGVAQSQTQLKYQQQPLRNLTYQNTTLNQSEKTFYVLLYFKYETE